jgi:hypothetical protein
MLSPGNRRILDQTGIVVVSANYAKQLTVSALPKDAGLLVQFNGGPVPLGEVDDWLREYTKGQSDQTRNTRIISIISIIIAIASLIVAIGRH